MTKYLAKFLLISLVAICALSNSLFAQQLPPAAALSWQDAATGETLFSSDDIVRFDWGRQLFELDVVRAGDLLALPLSVEGFREFILKDAEGVIYRGRFYRSSATAGYAGAVILLDQGTTKKLPAAPFFKVLSGYRTGADEGVKEQALLSERLRLPLQTAGKLAPIPEAESPIKSIWSSHGWVGGEEALKASVVLFPETIVVGKAAYLHLLLYKGTRTDFVFDQLRIEVNFSSATTLFTSKQLLAVVNPPLTANKIYVGKFFPWKGVLPDIPTDDANRPAIINSSQLPRYTKDALNENFRGEMVVALKIDVAGKVANIDVLQSSEREDLDRSAVRVLAKWIFTPAVRNGKIIESTSTVRFHFNNGEVKQEILPPEPIAVISPAGPLKLIITITAFKKNGDKFTPIDSWNLPEREIVLLPAPAE